MSSQVLLAIYILLGAYMCFLIYYVCKINPLSLLEKKYQRALKNGEQDKAFRIGRKYYKTLSTVIGKYHVKHIVDETIKNDLKETIDGSVL